MNFGSHIRWILLAIGSLALAIASPVDAAIALGKTNKPMIELSALILGGIGIFLIGIHFAGEHLQQMVGGRFERWIRKLTSSMPGILALGGLLGFLSQSGKAVAFILADLVQVKLLPARRAGLIVFWGNVGCSLIIFASMLSIKVFALMLLGITALGLTFHVPKRLVHSYGAMFGLAMIMYGLYLVKDGAAGVASSGWVPEFFEVLDGIYLLSFLVGMILTLMIQSNLAVTMLAIALASSHLLTLPEAAVVLYGAQAGSGLLTFIFSFHTKGRARQVVAYQIVFDLVATLVFVGLFVAEVVFEVPLLLTSIQSGFSNTGTQVIVLALVFQVVSAALLLAIRQFVYPRIEALFPPSVTESLSEPEYIHSTITGTPEQSALGVLLIENEQRRLLKWFPLYIEYVLGEGNQGQLTSPASYHAAFASISTLINKTLSSIPRNSLNQSMAESLISATKIQELLVRLENYVYQIVERAQSYRTEDKAGELGLNMMESIHFLLLFSIEALESGNQMDIDMLASLTQDRSEMMVNLRKAYFRAEHDLSDEARSFVLDITMLLENIVKALCRYGQVLKGLELGKV